MRPALTSVLCAAVVAAGCGGGSDQGEDGAAPTPRQAVADRVTDFWNAVESDDAEEACASLTDRGHRRFVRLGKMSAPGANIESCPAAVSTFSDAMADVEHRVTGAGGSFTADDVTLDDGSAQIQCEFRGAVFLERVGGEWLVSVPACYD